MQNINKIPFIPTKTFLFRSVLFGFYNLLIVINSFSQTFNTPKFKGERYSEEAGLAYRSVCASIKDDLGFMWFGTEDGLSRFDGNQIVSFNSSKNGLKSNRIQKILKDAHGHLWLIDDDFNNLKDWSVFDPKTLRKVNIDALSKSKIPFDEEDISTIVGNEHTRWIYIKTNSNKLYEYDGFSFEEIPIKLPNDIISFDLLNSKDHWVFTYILIDPKTKVEKEVRLDFYDKTLNLLNSYNLKAYTDVTFYDQIDDRTRLMYVEDEVVTKFCIYEDGMLSVDLTREKIFDLDHEVTIGFDDVADLKRIGDRIFYYHNGNKDAGFFEFDSIAQEYQYIDIASQFDELRRIWTFYVDENETIWVSTSFGFWKVVNSKEEFKSIRDNSESTLSAVRGIIGNDEDEILLNIEWKDKHLIINKSNDILIDRQKVRDNMVFCKNKDGKIYTASRKALYDFNFGENLNDSIEFEHITGVIWSMQFDDLDSLWLGNADGELWKLRGNTVVKVDKIANSFIYQIHVDDQKRMWIASEDGLTLYDQRNNVEIRTYSNIDGDYFLPSKSIYHINSIGNNQYWLASRDNGLLLVEWSEENQKLEVLDHVKTVAGLSSNRVYASFLDGNVLWFSSYNGIGRYNIESKLVDTYLEEDGLSSNEFNRCSYYRDNKGIIYFGSIDGVTYFDPKRFKNPIKKDESPIRITNFQAFNQNGDEDHQCSRELLESDKLVINSEN